MASAHDIYAAAVGHSHASAVQAVWDAAFIEGKKAMLTVGNAVDAAAGVDVPALQAENAALKDRVAELSVSLNDVSFKLNHIRDQQNQAKAPEAESQAPEEIPQPMEK